jgi:RNase H-fold protein (predicted Holliday junction resolvase)
VLWDESLSTVEAAERLRASGRSRREAQKDIDMHAAAVILQSYLDDQARGRSS